MEKIPERRFKSKSEQLAADLAEDLGKETKSINEERKAKGKSPVNIDITAGRHREYR